VNRNSQPLGALSDFVLRRLSREIRELLKSAPTFGNQLAELVCEEQVHRVQGRDPVCGELPRAGLYETEAVAHWAGCTRTVFEILRDDAPELSEQIEKALEFIQRIERQV